VISILLQFTYSQNNITTTPLAISRCTIGHCWTAPAFLKLRVRVPHPGAKQKSINHQSIINGTLFLYKKTKQKNKNHYKKKFLGMGIIIESLLIEQVLVNSNHHLHMRLMCADANPSVGL
jgi:hypothetical protein